MAAIYSGIHLKLKSPQTPWEDKLKLARFAWISSQCLLPNKEQVLLDWCTHALTGWHNKKVEFSQDVLEGLWCYLDDVIHSQKLRSLFKQGKTISLRQNMAQLLIDHLQECAHGAKLPMYMSTILSVCHGIFSSPALSSVFTTKYALMINLLAKLCALACRVIQQPSLIDHQMKESLPSQDELMTECPQTEPANDLETSHIKPNTCRPPDQPNMEDNSLCKPKKDTGSANLFEVLLQVLLCYLSVQRQQTNPNRVFTMVSSQLIQLLVLLRHLLTSGEFTASYSQLCLHQQLNRDIRVKIDSILQLALFPSEHLTIYKEELLPPKEDCGKRGTEAKGHLKPVSVILCQLSAQGYCDPSLHYSVKSNTLSLLFKFFLEKYRKVRGEDEEEQKMLCFYFLIRLVPALDLHHDRCSDSPASSEQPGAASSPASVCPPESWSLALLAVESLLSQALSADIYNVAADRIRHGEVQLNFYRALGQTLFNEAQPSIPSWYRCLKILLSLNHLILEADLDQLLSSAWVDAECIEARVQRARQVMLCSLLQTYTKLRQLPHLFSVLLSVICQPALDHLRPPLLSAGLYTSLRSCLLDTPPSQGLNICSLVLESIRKYILPDLKKEESEAEKMEIDGGKVDQEREDASRKLVALCQLLHAVLFSLKTLDNASPVPLVRQSQSLMEEMQQRVKELIQLLSTEKMHMQTNISLVRKTPKKGKKNLDHKDSEKVSESEMGELWEQKTLEAALLLKYTWVEVDTLFDIHCTKYTSLNQACSSSPVLTHTEDLLLGEILPAHLHPSPSHSPMSCLLLKLLMLQQMKKILLDSRLVCESTTTALLNRAAQFILAKLEFEVSLDEAQEWDGQIGSINASSYFVAHWHLVMSNLPLVIPHLSEDDVCCIANVLVSSLLIRQTDQSKAQDLHGCLTVSLISSQFLQGPVLAELPTLFSAVVQTLAQRIVCVFKAAHTLKVCPTLLIFQEEETGATSAEEVTSQPQTTLVKKETIVEDILASSKTGEVPVLLSDAQTEELVHLLQILSSLNPDGMNSEDLSSIFLLLFFMLTSTSRQLDQMATDPPESRGDALFHGKLLRILTNLLEGRSFPSVLKLIHGGTLLQAAVSSVLWHSSSAAKCSPDWSELIKALQGFIKSLVQLIIIRNSSVRLNLDQFASYLTSKEKACRDIAVSSSGTSDLLTVHLLLASLTSFSQAMTLNLGRSKPMDQTLAQMLARTTASLGPAIESVLKPQSADEKVIQPASTLGQAFIVEVVTVMLHCELSSLSVEDESRQKSTLIHMTLYQGFCQQILRELSSAPRPKDFVVSSLHFLSAFYKAVRKTREEAKEQEEAEKGENELDELYLHILQNVYKLLTAPWLSSSDVSELEPAVQEVLGHLVEKSTTSQFNLLLLMVKEGLDTSKLRAGNCREVLSAVIIIRLLSCCQLPETCSKALWLIAPQIISAMVFLLRSSSQYLPLTLTITIPVVTTMTSLLHRGEGLINNPHHVILVLGALHSVPLDHLTPDVYQSVFLAVHEALFAIIQCHPQVLLKAAPSFLNVFYRLVVSIMQEGRQRDSDTGVDDDVYLHCSRLIERMYSHIAAAPESFTMLSAFMVAQYVTELQKVTLRTDVKLHLTEGIYQILDLCKEQDVKFLTAGLPLGVREVFNELYGSYTHYHKAQRQGEDKYTV